MQPKALSAYKNIAFEFFELPNEKISRQCVGIFINNANKHFLIERI